MEHTAWLHVELHSKVNQSHLQDVVSIVSIDNWINVQSALLILTIIADYPYI